MRMKIPLKPTQIGSLGRSAVVGNMKAIDLKSLTQKEAAVQSHIESK